MQMERYSIPTSQLLLATVYIYELMISNGRWMDQMRDKTNAGKLASSESRGSWIYISAGTNSTCTSPSHTAGQAGHTTDDACWSTGSFLLSHACRSTYVDAGCQRLVQAFGVLLHRSLIKSMQYSSIQFMHVCIVWPTVPQRRYTFAFSSSFFIKSSNITDGKANKKRRMNHVGTRT